MSETVLVNFHCHSIFSDGEQQPEALAANLAAAGARFAALTDHDNIDGLPRFQDALMKRGVACLTGMELTTHFDGREAHLLGYGFDPEYPDLAATLRSLRQVRNLEVHSIADSLRKTGVNRSSSSDDAPGVSAAPLGQLEIDKAIDLIHRAGGKAFWAHPLDYELNPEKLSHYAGELKAMGLDGIEAIYAPYSDEQRARLRAIAQNHNLAICAGTDFHGANGPGSSLYVIEMPRADWIRFRQVFFASADFSASPALPGRRVESMPAERTAFSGKPHRVLRRSYVLRIFLPTLIAIALFLAVIWGIILPSFEQSLLDRKREQIRELTNSALSILASYERDEQAGLVSREQAQAMAVKQIETLRYGPEGKDYFWIQDLQPRMIMHPYRSDLNGQELNRFTDPRGVRIFVEFAQLVRREGEGYIDYVWQWNDDPQRLEPKESYVKGFEPWGWVIGTGIYIDDVNNEIARIEQRLINTSLAISGVVVLLLVFVLQQSLRVERERQEVLDSLRESTERYHTLIEATTEGTLLIIEARCRYANPTFLSITGYTARQLEFLELADLLPPEADNRAIWEIFETINGEPNPGGVVLEGVLRHASGTLVECVLAMNPIVFAGQQGYILLARDVAQAAVMWNGQAAAQAVQTVPVGIFRARAARQAAILEMNPAGHALAALTNKPRPALADLFSDTSDFDTFMQTLLTNGEVQNVIVHLESSDASARFLALAAKLVRDDRGAPLYIDGTLEDVTAQRRQAMGREALIDKLQASLLFLHEPIAHLGREVVMCPMDTTIDQLARQMTNCNVTAALVASNRSEVIGIVTDHDLRARVLAENIPPSALVHTIMSAPLTKIPEEALIYEALMRMEEKGVRHLAVEDRNGQIVSVIDSKSLIQFQRYGPIVLSREISRSLTPQDVARTCAHAAPLVKALMDNSARPRHVTNMLASICDAATVRLIQLAIEELGPPPTTFAFIGMGSQGRQEQTLVTDQDNGIIFAPTAEADLPRVSAYFLRLGKLVCSGLDHAGYPLCRGQVMANNPRWCRSLPAWLSGFDEWIRKSEPQEMIDLSIFFDFRTVYGDTELTHDLRSSIHNALRDQPAFFHLFAQNALMFKPPFRLLGNIYLSGGATEHTGEINLKDAMMPMVSFARLYALRHQIQQTHTLERIEALSERNIILPSSRDEIVAAYDFLMQLRLQTQLSAIQAGRLSQNIINPGKLGYIQQELLKQAFTQIAAVQKKVSYDFLGGV